MTNAPPPNGADRRDDDAPAVRPRPQYGEYAPPGWVSPVQPVDSPHAAPEVPAAAAPPPPSGARAASPRSPAPATGAPGARYVPAWDRGFTIGLLVVGFFGALTGWLTGSALADSLGIALQQYGIDPGSMATWLDAAGQALVISHVVLYLAAVALTVWLIRAKRPAFWAPLVAGIIAAIIFWSIMSAAVAPYATQLQP